MTNESDKLYFNLKEDIYIVDSVLGAPKDGESSEMNLSSGDWLEQQPDSETTDSPDSNYPANVPLLSSEDPTLGTPQAELDALLNSDVIRKPGLWDPYEVDLYDLGLLQFPLNDTELNDKCLSNVTDENALKNTPQNNSKQICTESNVLFDKNMNIESSEYDDGSREKIVSNHSSDMTLNSCDGTTHTVAPDSNGDTSPKIIEETKKVQRIKIWVCNKPNCGKVFKEQYKMDLHIRKHERVLKSLKCSLEGCIWTFPTLFKLKRHEKTHLNMRDYMCSSCKKFFSTAYNLKTHMKLHKRPAKFSCLVSSCGLKFKTRREMEYHMKTHGLAWAPYKCKHPGCEKTFYSRSSYTAHARSHQHKENELLCQWEGCGRKFDKPCRLKAHMRQHTGDKPYKCHYKNCTWAFGSSSKLKRHLYIHEDQRNFKCTVNGCRKAFQRSEHLKEHASTHSAQKAFECNICKQKFNSKARRRMHFKKHHPDHDSKNPNNNVSDPPPAMSLQASDTAKSQTLEKQSSDILTDTNAIDNVSKSKQTTDNVQSSGTDGKPMSSKKPRMKRRRGFVRGCARNFISHDDYQGDQSTQGADAMQNTVDSTAIEQSETTDQAVMLNMQDSQVSDGAFFQTEEK